MNTDRPIPTTELERILTALTEGPQTDTAADGLWLRALAQADAPPARATPLWKRRVPGLWLSAAAAVVLLVVIVGVFAPSKAGHSSVGTPAAPSVSAVAADQQESGQFRRGVGDGGFGRSREFRNGGANSGEDAATGADNPPVGNPADRAVIRKTTLDLATPDVRAAFSKAGLVINEALGEYVETSSLTGEGPAAQGSLTLRVSARRLSEALNQLRPLGVVVSEATTGQDVTDAVVDLDARIRNEQRIEKELLALIEKRPDAPLKELMEIRSQLAGVRGQIESLIGQRERIGRMVSLATILVTIRPPTPVDALKPEKADGIGTYFSSSIADAWRSSLQALIDTAAFLVRTLVGGLVWWVLAAAVTVACVRAFRRAFPRGGAEPAPAA